MEKLSDNVRDFMTLLNQSKTEYNIARERVATEEKRTQDLLHAIEFEGKTNERNKLCTRLKNARVERRRNKDIVEELEPIVEFLDDPKNKHFLNTLQTMLGKLRKVEKYHETRTYIPRLKEDI